MVRLDRLTEGEFARWLELSARRQAEDRAWVNGSNAGDEQKKLDAMIPILLLNGLNTPGHTFRAARDERGTELGFAWVGVLPGAPEGTRVLFDVYVHEEHRGRGMGRAILEQMFDLAKADGARTMLLYVRADNAPAQALYTSLGFKADPAPDGARDLQMTNTL